MRAPEGRTILEAWEHQRRIEDSKGHKARDSGDEFKTSVFLCHNARHVDGEVESGRERDPQDLKMCSHRYRCARHRGSRRQHSPLGAEVHSGTFGVAAI